MKRSLNTLFIASVLTINENCIFGYDDKHLTHQPRTMFDWGSKTQLSFFGDANGNLAQMIGCKQNSGRLHEWDVKRNSRTEKSPVDSSRSKCGARVCQSKHRTQLDRLRFVFVLCPDNHKCTAKAPYKC